MEDYIGVACIVKRLRELYQKRKHIIEKQDFLSYRLKKDIIYNIDKDIVNLAEKIYG